MSGQVVHFEVPYDDRDRAGAFYKDVFGWDLQSWDGGFEYTMVTTGPTGDRGPSEPGFINGGMLRRTDSAGGGPVVVVAVDDIDAALERIQAQGGTALTGRQPVGEMGWSAYFKDSEGNVVGLWQSAG